MTFDKLRDEETLYNRLNLQDEEEILRSCLTQNDKIREGILGAFLAE